MKRQHTYLRERELEELAAAVQVITAQQKDHPGYGQDIMDSMVNSELRRLERESLLYFARSGE